MKNKTLVKTLSALLAVVMVLCAAPLNGFVGLELPELFSIEASAVTYSGSCGTNVNWSLDTEIGVLNITGSGDMEDYVYGEVPWYSYAGSIKIINIANGITRISHFAFDNCSNVTIISIPDSVTFIGQEGLPGYLNLKCICYSGTEEEWLAIRKVYDGDEEGHYARGLVFFEAALQEIKTENGFEYIVTENKVFVNSYSGEKTEVTISAEFDGKPVTGILGKAFFNNKSISSVEIPESITNIGRLAFFGCSSLEKIRLPENLKFLGEKAFANCVKLSGIVIDCANLNIYNASTFASCGIETDGIDVVFSDKVQSIPDVLFSGGWIIWPDSEMPDVSLESSKVKSVTIGKNVVSIGYDVFGHQKNLIELNFNATDCVSGSSVSMSSVAEVNIGNNVKRIPENFLSQCPNLTEVIIPESVTEIGKYAFSNCENLEKVIILNENKIDIGDNIFDYSPKATICCKENSYMHSYAEINGINYLIVDEENNPNYEIKNEVLVSYKGNAESVYMNSVSKIGFGAFEENTKLKRVELSNVIDRVYNRAFNGCTNLEIVIIPRSVTSIGDNAFEGCDKLTVYCYADSYAESYAEEHGIKYEYITFALTENKVELYSDEVLNLGTAYNIDIVEKEEILWNSDDESVVKVAQNGMITAVGEGTAIVTAKTEYGFETECEVTVFEGKRPFDGIVLTLTNSEGDIVKEETVSGDVTEYSFTELEDGEYTVTILKETYATREYIVTAKDGKVEVEFTLNHIGDINGDSKISVVDYTQLLRHVKKTSTLDGYAFDCADVNGDGKLSVLDYTKLLRHVKKTETLW